MEGKVVTGPPQQAAEQLDTPAPAPKRKKVIADKPPKATQVQAALEKLLTDLEIKQYNRVKGLKTNAARIFAAHKHNPEQNQRVPAITQQIQPEGDWSQQRATPG